MCGMWGWCVSGWGTIWLWSRWGRLVCCFCVLQTGVVMLWWQVSLLGGPLDGAEVCVPCRGGRVDNWVWAHECVVWDGDGQVWGWAAACVSGFYQLSGSAGSSPVGEGMPMLVFRWHDVRFAGSPLQDWEFGD
jgi:hypothetical protein